jgi:nucleotidyltransferase AbiEii toxin of type IV toxin-antitoxin system
LPWRTALLAKPSFLIKARSTRPRRSISRRILKPRQTAWQRPRDLFDARDLLANEGIDDALRRAFIVYLLSHDRPMSEVLAPTRKDISGEFARGFQGMTDESVTLDELTGAREALIAAAVGGMPDEHRRFLISFERGEAEWPLLGLDGVTALPAVRWRQQNLDKMARDARAALVARLEEVLGQ